MWFEGGIPLKRALSHQVLFPVIPSEAERNKQSLFLRIDKITEKNATATLTGPDYNYFLTYEFEFHKNSCWHLLSINDLGFTKNRSTNLNWLENIFPSMKNCTPSNFYFDDETKRSNNGILEKNGYRVYQVDEYTAKYKIREKFFGFDAVEIAIPSATHSIYAVTIETSAKNFSGVIKNKTGYNLPLFDKKFKVQSGMAYLIPEGRNKSILVCDSFDGGF